MPWKIYRNSDGKHCVHKLNADDSMGELVACHATRSEALAQQRALYASEAKEITDATLSLLKEIADDSDTDKPERASAVLDEWKERMESIPGEDDEDEPEDAVEEDNPAEKECADCAEQKTEKPTRQTLLSKLKTVGESIASWFKNDTDYDNSGLTIWKEGNQYWWMARYSNKFRDQDNPPEIISSDSHKRFVRLVKEGKVPLPELWLWHKKEWKVGNALAVEYDDSGFAIAIGVFDADKGFVAEALQKSKDPTRVSHGMPLPSLARDAVDPTIIIEHETREISPLPAWAAANKLTGFVVLSPVSNKEESMAIPDETKEEWVKKLGIDPQTLTSLETANAADASKAMAEGMESKEADASAQPATQPGTPETPVSDTPVSAPVQDLTPLRDAVTEAVSNLVTPLMARLDALEASMKELKESSAAQQEALKGTPAASLASIIGSFAQSAVGSTETRVDGRTELAKSKPKEAAPAMNGRTPVPFINELLNGGK